MIFRLIDFALVVLKLLMFKVCGIIGISKIEFINFSGTERAKSCKKVMELLSSKVAGYKLTVKGLHQRFLSEKFVKHCF